MGKINEYAYRLAQPANKGGYMAYDKGKTVFKDINCREEINKGIVRLERKSYVTKGKTIFAHMSNITTVLPDKFFTIDFFKNTGVPDRLYVCKYGDSLVTKEVYNSKTFIKAYNADGDAIISESCDTGKRGSIAFRQADELLLDWIEITKELYRGIAMSIKEEIKEKANVEDILNNFTLEGIHRVLYLSNNFIVMFGKYQKMICWFENGKAHRVWADLHVEFSGTDITPSLEKQRKFS